MTKVVLKTIAITLASVVLAIGLFFGSFALFSPITLANFFDGMGCYSLSITFYESNFNKTQKVSDLATLVVKIDQEKDSERAEKYLKILVEFDKFEEFCASEDKYSQSQMAAKDYYLGEYVYALLKNGKFLDAFNLSFDYIDDNGYTENNPCRVMVVNAEKLLTDDQIYTLKKEIYDCRLSLTDQNDLARANSDAEWLSLLIG